MCKSDEESRNFFWERSWFCLCDIYKNSASKFNEFSENSRVVLILWSTRELNERLFCW